MINFINSIVISLKLKNKKKIIKIEKFKKGKSLLIVIKQVNLHYIQTVVVKENNQLVMIKIIITIKIIIIKKDKIKPISKIKVYQLMKEIKQLKTKI